MKKGFCFIIVVCALLLSQGCMPRTITKTPVRHLPSAEDILKKIPKVNSADNVLRASGRITVTESEGTYSKRFALAARKPASLRIETIPVFGTPDLLLSANSTCMKVFLPHENTFYIGRTTRENFASFTHLFIGLDDIVPLLMGTPTVVQKEAMTYKSFLEESLYRIDILSGRHIVKSLWIEPEGYRVLRSTVFRPDGGNSYTVHFSDFTAIGGSIYPGRLRITISEPKKMEAKVRYTHMEMSQDTEESDLFDLKIPRGARVIRID